METTLGRELPDGIVAESWEIAAHPNGQSKVAAGPLAGSTLSQVQQQWGVHLLGNSATSKSFPLLIKLLDPNSWLSVQVHPDDTYAREHAGDLGKTELWIILHAEPDAEIIYGLKAGVDRDRFADSAATGAIDSMLHRVPIRAGDAIYLPAGTVHALGPGAIVAEIQQNSDTTYRLYDWGRTDADGQSRPLHVSQALDVIDWSMVEPAVAAPPTLAAPQGWTREALADLRTIGGPAAAHLDLAGRADTACPHFGVDRLTGSPGAVWNDACNGTSFHIWGALSGEATLHWSGETVKLQAISWLLLPAALGNYEIRPTTECVLLRIQ